MAGPEFVKDDYFKIDVECHLSGEANKKYFNYFPEYRKWVYGTAETSRAFNAVPHHVTKDWKEPPVTKAEKSALPEEDQLKIMAILAQEYNYYENIGNIYTRFSGKTRFIELELYLKKDLSLEEITLLGQRIESQLRKQFQDIRFILIPLPDAA